MFMGPPHLLRQETSKPQRVSVTLGRLGAYFRPFWPALVGVALFVIVSTYAQVLSPALIGEAVDCYLVPAPARCWYTVANPAAAPADQISGLGGLILIVVGLYVLSSACSGLQFYLMSWAGQHVLRRLRVELFRHLQRLSLGYYSRNEAGGVMSRITNDMDTLQQTLGFALVSVVGARRRGRTIALGLAGLLLGGLAGLLWVAAGLVWLGTTLEMF